MSFTRKKDIPPSEMLDMVLPQYKKASEMGEDPELEQGKLYKSITDKTNLVYLITNPITWKETQNANGSYTRHRPPPKLMGHIDDLAKTTIRVTPNTNPEDLSW